MWDYDKFQEVCCQEITAERPIAPAGNRRAGRLRGPQQGQGCHQEHGHVTAEKLDKMDVIELARKTKA